MQCIFSWPKNANTKMCSLLRENMYSNEIQTEKTYRFNLNLLMTIYIQMPYFGNHSCMLHIYAIKNIIIWEFSNTFSNLEFNIGVSHMLMYYSMKGLVKNVISINDTVDNNHNFTINNFD